MIVCNNNIQPSEHCQEICVRWPRCALFKEFKKMSYQPTQQIMPSYHGKPVTTTKMDNCNNNINDAAVFIVYGDVKGNINNCQDVVVINGDVKGNISQCENVCGLLSD